MTTDDILRMANHCRFRIDAEDFVMPREGNYALRLARFALLVRDQMISEGWRQCAKGQKTTQFCGMVEQARLEEREACAIAGGAAADAGRDVAAAIRARGKPDPKVTHLNEWARDRLARHGIQIPENDDANPSF